MTGVTGVRMRRNIRACTFHAHTCMQADQHWYRDEQHTCIHHVACLYHQCSIKRIKKNRESKKICGGDKCGFISIYTNTRAKQQAQMHACRSIHQHAFHVICVHTRIRETQVRRVFVSCIALTLSFASSAAPCPTSTSKHGTCPHLAAHMRAVMPF